MIFNVLATIWSLIVTFFFSSLGLRHAKSDTQAIPLLKRKRYESTLSPKGFLLVFVCALMSTASRQHEARMGIIGAANHETDVVDAAMPRRSCKTI